MESNIAQGQMFIFKPEPIDGETIVPSRVWVKVTERDGHSMFVDNAAMVKVSIGKQKKLHTGDTWHISDGYYGKMVREGKFVPIDDLREVEPICEELGWPLPQQVDLD